MLKGLLLVAILVGIAASARAADAQYWKDGCCTLVYQTSEDYFNAGETVRIYAHREDSLRVQSTYGNFNDEALNALEPFTQKTPPKITIKKDGAEIENGNIRCVISSGFLTFYRVEDGKELTGEYQPPYGHGLPAREFQIVDTANAFKVTARFSAYEDEKIYGLGQHMNGRMDQKGMNFDLRQVNTEVSIPFFVSSRGYGFLWNNPSFGQAQFGLDRTQWSAEETSQLDYWITTSRKGSKNAYADIMAGYVDATGHSPPLPEFASGFWQCKLRYRSQDEVLDAARGYHKRGLPISVIVIDFFHWKEFGDWALNPDCFPDPKGMVEELARMGIKLMVSFWPLMGEKSVNYNQFRRDRLMVGTRNGDITRGEAGAYIYDPFNPKARASVWSIVKQNYYDNGIKVFWLDAAEPEWTANQYNHQRGRYFAGTDVSIGNMFPLLNARTMFDGMRSEGEREVINLSRSAWAGSQKYGAALWSGDIDSTFDALRIQIRAGLNVMMSGIPWWTTDIGGFFNGDPSTPEFRELIVRWFQYGAFCPLFRLHGARIPNLPDTKCGSSGGNNEVWTFGDEAYDAIKPIMFLREALRPYIMKLMDNASRTGTPVMRPMFFEFPDDPATQDLDDQFMFGPEWLVAPIYEHKSRSRKVYLPAGEWKHHFSGKVYTGRQTYEIEGELSEFPLFRRHDSNETLMFRTGTTVL